jgi:hypothetical protein
MIIIPFSPVVFAAGWSPFTVKISGMTTCVDGPAKNSISVTHQNGIW